MQKWSLEPFEDSTAVAESSLASPEDFEPTSATAINDSSSEGNARGFRRESGFTDSASLMNSLTTEERSWVYELVDLDLSEEYKESAEKLEEDYHNRLAAKKDASDKQLNRIAEKLAVIMAGELKESAAAAARLAVQMAEKITRQTIDADPSVLARTIETTLFKISSNTPLTINASATDASWLNEQPDLKERLNIGEIVADRRIEDGGGLISCAGREWDASLSRQIGNLSEIVEEMIATSEVSPERLLAESLKNSENIATDAEPETAPEPEVNDVPGVE